MLGVDVKRAIRPEDVRCPAGTAVGEAGIRCGVEHSVLDVRTNPSSCAAFCMSGYEDCPSWKAQRDYEDEVRRHDKDVLDARRDARPPLTPLQMRRQRLEEQKELATGNSKEARRFQARVREQINRIQGAA